MWFIFALLSAIFAALTSILAKIGIEGVNSNLATAIRTIVFDPFWKCCYYIDLGICIFARKFYDEVYN